METAIIGNPFAVPDLTQHLVEFVEVRKQRRSNGNHILIHRCRLLEITVRYKTGVTGPLGSGEQVESRQCWRHYRSSHYQRVTYYVTMRISFHAHD